MSKVNPEETAKKILQDLNELSNRVGNYAFLEAQSKRSTDIFSTSQLKRDSADKVFSVVGELGAPLFFTLLENEQINDVVNILRKSKDQYIADLSQADKEKFEYKVALTEARLKGFKEVNTFLPPEEREVIMRATTQAITELGKENPPVPKDDYKEALFNKINSHLPKEGTDLEKAIVITKAQQFEFEQKNNVALYDTLTKAAQQSAKTLTEIFNDPTKVLPIINEQLESRLLKNNNIDDTQKNHLKSQLQSIKPLWEFDTPNVSNLDKINYLNMNRKIDSKTVNEVFTQITNDLVKVSDLNQLRRIDPAANKFIQPQTIASLVTNEAIKTLEKKGFAFSENEKKKINEKITPALTKLGSEYLQSHGEDLATEIAASLNSRTTMLTRVLKFFHISNSYNISGNNLEEMVRQSNAQHLEASKNYEFTKVIGNQMRANNITQPQLVAGLQEFSRQNEVPPLLKNKFNETPKSLSNEDLAEIRRVNPVAFDQMISSSKNSPSSPAPAHKAPPAVPPRNLDSQSPPSPAAAHKEPPSPPTRSSSLEPKNVAGKASAGEEKYKKLFGEKSQNYHTSLDGKKPLLPQRPTASKNWQEKAPMPGKKEGGSRGY